MRPKQIKNMQKESLKSYCDFAASVPHFHPYPTPLSQYKKITASQV